MGAGKVTKELAIKILSTRDRYGCLCGWTSGYTEALDMAIEALKKRPKGHWVGVERLGDRPSYKWYRCSECEMLVKNVVNYCPKCGSYNGGTNEIG